MFVVLDNQNLEDLWDWENRTLHIDRGRLFFHFNPKLCADKINTFAQKTNLTDYTDLEVATNGDKIACEYIFFSLLANLLIYFCYKSKFTTILQIIKIIDD